MEVVMVKVKVEAFQRSFPVHNTTKEQTKKSIYLSKKEKLKGTTFQCCLCMRGCLNPKTIKQALLCPSEH
jgi:hypothetical protein